MSCPRETPINLLFEYYPGAAKVFLSSQSSSLAGSDEPTKTGSSSFDISLRIYFLDSVPCCFPQKVKTMYLFKTHVRLTVHLPSFDQATLP